MTKDTIADLLAQAEEEDEFILVMSRTAGGGLHIQMQNKYLVQPFGEEKNPLESLVMAMQTIANDS